MDYCRVEWAEQGTQLDVARHWSWRTWFCQKLGFKGMCHNQITVKLENMWRKGFIDLN